MVTVVSLRRGIVFVGPKTLLGAASGLFLDMNDLV